MPMIGRYQAVGTYGNRAEFTSSGNWTVPAGVTRVRVRLVGGAGGGSTGSNTPGANGYFREFEMSVTPAAVMPVVIGAGGASTPSSSSGTAGGDTTFGGVTASGGCAFGAAAGQPGGTGWGAYGKSVQAGAGIAGFCEIAY